jgi:photosynthetic reaction center H subunit
MPKIVPMRVAPDFSVASQDVDPRGLPVLGADGELGGFVMDIWVDLSEPQIRYLEVSLPKSAPSAVPAEVAEEGTDAAAGSVLLPMNFVRVNRKQGHLKVLSILGRHFANVPRLARPDQVTLREEDKVCAYYAAGTLYAKAERAEPLM